MYFHNNIFLSRQLCAYYVWEPKNILVALQYYLDLPFFIEMYLGSMFLNSLLRNQAFWSNKVLSRSLYYVGSKPEVSPVRLNLGQFKNR